MNRDTWKELPPAEWKRRLNRVSELALQRLAAHGFGDDNDEDISDMIAYGEGKDSVAALLNPGLAVERANVDRLIEGVSVELGMESAVISYAVAVAEAAFQFGLITGCHLPWSVIEAMPAPDAPPRTKGGAK